MTSGFHTYGVDWEPDTITWYFDGQKVFQTATPADLNKPMYMLADLAVGGFWPGSPDAQTPFPAGMQIDYIRAYQPDAPSIGGASGGQQTAADRPISPFTSVTLSDPNVATVTATVMPSSPNGTLSVAQGARTNTVGANVVGTSGGGFSLTGTVAQVQAALQSLVFTPTASLSKPGSPVTTNFAITLKDSNGGTATNSTTSVVAAAPAVHDDFSGVGRAGITLQNSAGQLFEWQVNGAQVTSSANIANPGSSWREVGTGDFNGDGKADILVQNSSNGQVWEYDMNGNQIASSSNVAIPGSAWHVVGTGDFNGDGRSDILLQNSSTSQIWEYEMNGSRIIGSGNVGTPGSAWHVVGTGDFYGDGQSEILLQNDSGQIAEWQVNGTQFVAAGIVTNPGPTWHVVGVGDFNGDGRSDALLQNSSTGQVWEYQMNGTTITATNNVANPGTAWHVAAVGDYNGDGKSDVVLQNSGTGQVWEWLMNGNSVFAANNLGNSGNPGLIVHT
jgi:hypothetical protein